MFHAHDWAEGFFSRSQVNSKIGYVTYDNNANSQIQGYDVLTNGNSFVLNVAYVADLKLDLISIPQLTNANRQVEFYKKHIYVMEKDRKECLIKSDRNKNMYAFDINMTIGKCRYDFSQRYFLILVGYCIIDWLI